MKRIFILLVFILTSISAHADCGQFGMSFFPKQKQISKNSMFIIQGYATSQSTISSFKNRLIYLESDTGELVELKLQEILIGQLEITQAIFRLSQQLKPNTTYFLKYSEQTKGEEAEMQRYNSQTEKYEKVFWTTSTVPFLQPLNSDLKIEFEKTELIYYGCGPSVNAIFNVNETAETWYRTEVVNLISNKKTVYYITAWKGKLNVGQEMCAGAFTFDQDATYEVRFTAMNTDGKTIRPTDLIVLENPFNND